MEKRILSLLLCIVMCLSLFPMSAFAEGNLSYVELMTISANSGKMINENGVEFTLSRNDARAYSTPKFDGVSFVPWSDSDMSNEMTVAGNVYTVMSSSINGTGELVTTFAFTVENNKVVGLTVSGFEGNRANRNGTYVIAHTHDFTGDYKDNGDGTHSRKCTGCDEYDTAEAHSYTDGVCVCGAEDLETVKAAATAELNAAIAAAKCGEAKEVLTQALNDLATAQTVAAVKGIAGNAKNTANQYDNDYSTRLVGYTSALDAELNKPTASESLKARIEKLKEDIANAPTISELDRLFLSNIADIQLEGLKDAAVSEINAAKTNANASIAEAAVTAIGSAQSEDEINTIKSKALADMKEGDELAEAKEYTKNAIDELVPADASDELKAAAKKAKDAVDAAKTMDEIDEVCDEFSKAYDFLKYKEERIASFEEALNSDEYSDAFKALVEKMMAAVKAADSKEAIDAIGEEYSPKLDLQYDKDEACAAIEELLPNDPSDAVKKIASDACDKIQASDDSTGFDSFVNETRLAIEAQLQKEAELAPAKEAAIAEITKAKTDANASVAEDAIKAINDATTVDEVNKLKEQALADMAKADAAAELAAAKKSAIDTINAYKSDVNASIADAAIADINKATTTTEVSNILNQAIPNMQAAELKVEFKGKITNELLPAAKCDEAKAILNKALSDLDDAVTLDEVNTVFYNAQGQANGQDGAFTGMLAGYTNAFNSAITDVATDETKAFVSKMLKDLDEATSIARINEIYNSNKDKISVCINRDKSVDDFNKYIDSDEYSDEMKAIAREAIEKLMQAESVSDVEKITKEYTLKLNVQEDKETMRKVSASDEYSDEMKALAQNALDELDDVTTSQELTNLWNKYNPLMRLQLAKDAARKEVKELLPENASDAVKKIVSDACDEIQANDDPDKYADIIEAARQAIEAQLQKEKELAPAKEAAIAEINDAKTDANATVAENAIKAINDATTVDEVNKLKEQALTDMAKADATAELIAAKEEAKAAVDKAVPTNASDAVAAVAENTKAAIDKANSIEDVNAAKEAGIAAIKKQIAADIAAAELLETKEAAKKAIDDAVPADASNEVKAAAEAAKNDIDAATTTDAVNTAKENGLTAIDDQIAADKLAEAKEAAKKAILAEQGDDTAENVTKASRDAIAAIDAATTVDAVNAEKAKGVEAIRTVKAANKPVSYTIITGADSTWTKGSTDVLLVRSNAPFAKFVSVKVDGAVVAASNYIAEEGSTIIKLKPAYLETLKLGKHSIEILSADGSASTYFTINAKSDSTSPKTGDNSNMFLWITLLFISSGALVGTAVYGKKRKRAE